jgi:hypothetical protein
MRKCCANVFNIGELAGTIFPSDTFVQIIDGVAEIIINKNICLN